MGARRNARGAQPFGVPIRFQVAGDRGHAAAPGEGPGGRLENRRLARPGRTHQVDGQHAVGREVFPVVGGGPVVDRRMRSWIRPTPCAGPRSRTSRTSRHSSSIWPSRISSPAASAAGAPHARSSGAPADPAGGGSGNTPSAPRRVRSRGSLAHRWVRRGRWRKRRRAGRARPRRVRRCARARDGRRGHGGRLSSSTRSMSAVISEYSCIAPLRCSTDPGRARRRAQPGCGGRSRCRGPPPPRA